MAHLHSVYDADPHFVIDPATRRIKNESSKVILVQGDHNSERFTFEIARFVDGHDMSLCDVVEIHYDNIDSSTKDTYSDVEEVGDLQISPASDDVVIFSWLISGNATQYKGSLNFSIGFQCHDNEGNVDYELGTLTHEGISVGERIRNSKSVIERVADILSKWRKDLFGIGDTEEAKIRAASQEEQAAIAAEGTKQVDAVAAKGEGVLASIPDEYEAVATLADENARLKAGAIILEAEGKSIAVSDSADAYLHGLKLFGKTTQITTSGRNVLDVEETLTFSYIKDIATFIPAGTYVLTWLSQTHEGEYTPYIRFRDNDVGALLLNSNNGSTITLTKDESQVYIYSNNYNATGSVGVSATITQLMLSTNGGDYEPYTGAKASPSPEYPQELVSVKTPKITVCGKNLIKCPFITAESKNGLTLTNTSDGGIKITGTATKYTEVLLYGAYGTTNTGFYFDTMLSGGTEKIKIHGFRYDETGTYIGVTTTGAESKIIPASAGLVVAFSIGDGDEVDEVIYPMLMHANAREGFEAYGAPTTFTISHTLPAIPVTSGGNYTDSDGQQWVCDEVDFERGVYVKRINSVTFDGTQNLWPNSYQQNLGYFVFGMYADTVSSLNLPDAIDGTPVLCDKLIYREWGTLTNDSGNKIFNVSNAIFIYLADQSIQTSEAMKEYLTNNPITFQYILATPIETPLSDSEIAAFRTLKSNKPTTTIMNDKNAFVSVDYVADTKTYIDNKIAELINNS